MSSSVLRVLARAALLAVAVPAMAMAQQPVTVSGRVISEANAPVQGASVSIPSLGVGSFTNEQGRYTFTVPAGRATGQVVSVTARRIGFTPLSRNVTLTSGATLTQDFTLTTATTQLEAVVVTALGQERERSQLGTSVTQLSTEQLNTTRTQNLMQQVQGKVAGVQITGAGTQGGSANIVIRGQNSLTGSNQPLYVVDGIPVSNSTRGGSLGGGSITTGGRDFGNAIADLNPDDIETLTILKGPNAAALYGSRASNGVVVITTKRGATSGGNIRTDLSTTISMERPSRLWDLQNQYGQGSGGSFTFVDGAGSGDCDGCDQSYGPKLDGRLIHQFTDGTDTTVKSPWVAHPDNVKSFFNTGRTISTTLAASGGTERANARLSLGADAVDGIIPNNKFQKVTSQLAGQMLVGSKLTTNGSIQYIRNNAMNRPPVGYNGSALEQFFWFGRQVDLDALRNYQAGSLTNNGPTGREFNWNYNFHNNPFWIQYENPSTDARDRFIGNVSATYNIAEGINATLRTGSDIFRYNANQKFAPGNLGVGENLSYQGAFSTITDYSNENNTDLLVTANRSVLPNLRINATAGGNLRRSQFNTESQSTNALLVSGLYNISNSAVAPTVGQSFEKRATNSAYGSLAFTLNDWWTVEGTARNDWSSTLPEQNNSYFYPSVNTSLVLTDAVPSLKQGPLSYLKVRGSIARVGSDASPYQLATVFQGVSAKFNGQPQYQLGDVLANADLKPEITQSSEAGAEIGLWDGRVSFDGTVYANKTRNQILNATVSSTSGFSSKAINAGLLENHGIELLLNVTPIRMANGFDWTSSFNYAHNTNKVSELAPGITSITLGSGLFADSRVVAAIGQPYGQIMARGFVRDSATGAIMTSSGRPLGTADFLPLGNIQPKWTGGWNNTFNYKGFNVGVLFDFKRGGNIVSYTNSVGESSGQLASSLYGREVDWNNPGVVVKGIDRATCGTGSHATTNGTGQYVCVGGGTPNARNITSEVYFQSLFQNMEPYIYDASYTKLRELRVGFDLPSKWAAKLNAQSASIGLIGRNLFTWTNVPNVDPEFAYSNSNNQGFEYAVVPNPRSIGFSLRITP
jgi:TonB-linked SusC/RagA family outer membrane protein